MRRYVKVALYTLAAVAALAALCVVAALIVIQTSWFHDSFVPTIFMETGCITAIVFGATPSSTRFGEWSTCRTRAGLKR